MNQTSATSQSGASLLPSGIGTITTIHLALIVLIAVAAIAIIVAGIRRKQLRDRAQHQVARHAREAGVAAPSTIPADAPSPPAPPAPPPSMVAVPPAAPPIVDQPVIDERVVPAPLADEPIAAAAPLDASPAGEAVDPVPASSTPAPADGEVTQLKGLGPKVAGRLAELGITRIGQIAALDDDAAIALDARLGAFSGRLVRDRWVEQARFLSTGDRAGFEAVFGRL